MRNAQDSAALLRPGISARSYNGYRNGQKNQDRSQATSQDSVYHRRSLPVLGCHPRTPGPKDSIELRLGGDVPKQAG